jgi:hypothetical protein
VYRESFFCLFYFQSKKLVVKSNNSGNYILHKAGEKVRPYMAEGFARTFLHERLVAESSQKGKELWWIPGSDDMYLFVPHVRCNSSPPVYDESEEE